MRSVQRLSCHFTQTSCRPGVDVESGSLSDLAAEGFPRPCVSLEGLVCPCALLLPALLSVNQSSLCGH